MNTEQREETGKASSGKSVTPTNKIDGQSYFVSIVTVSKRIQIPLKLSGNLDIDAMTLGNMDFNDIKMQAAIYPISVVKKKLIGTIFSKPLLVINLDDALRQIAIDDFKDFVATLLTEERLEDIYSELNGRKLFEKHGYMAARCDLWSFFSFRKVKNIFIFRNN